MKYMSTCNMGEYLKLDKSQNTCAILSPRGCDRTLAFAFTYAVFGDWCLAVTETLCFFTENSVQITKLWINLEAKDIA